MSRESYAIAHAGELERTGKWSLVRRSLGCRSFGVNIVELAPGETIPEHDESERDQEEIFYVIAGAPTLIIDGEEHALGPGSFARIDPHHRRTARNDGQETASLMISSAPRTSGYEPMGWA